MRCHLTALALAGALLLSACASIPADRDVSEVNRLLAERGVPVAPKPAGRVADTPLPAEALSLEQSIRLAFARSPKIREVYAELGMAAADLQQAAQLPSIGIGYQRLSGGGEAQVTRGLSLAFSELLLRRSRMTVADTNHAMTRHRVTAQLLALEGQVGHAWFEYVAARHSAELAAVSASAARAGAEYAGRLHEAGNLPARALAEAKAAASGADIAFARAEARSLRARAAFAALVGLSVRDAWQVPARLPALPHADSLPADLAEQTYQARTDLLAAGQETYAFTMALHAARTWRWLGDVEIGYERETETDGARLRGPSLHLSLPLFHWNRAGLRRAEAQQEAARARFAALELGVRNELSLAADQLATTRRIAETYRDALVPGREAIYARTLEQTHFMLAGAFEALAARRQQYDAYQEYLEATRDYWLAWLDLRKASGGVLAAPVAGTSLQFDASSAPGAGEHP